MSTIETENSRNPTDQPPGAAKNQRPPLRPARPVSTKSPLSETAIDQTKSHRAPLRPVRKSSGDTRDKAEPAPGEPFPAGDSKTSKKVQPAVNKTAARPGRPVPKTAVRSAAVSKPADGSIPAASSESSIEELLKKNQRLELLIDISKQFSANLDFNKLMVSIFERVLSILEAEAGSFWIPDPKTAENVCNIAEGPAKKQVQGLRLPAGQGIVGWVIENRQNTIIFDASQDTRFSQQVDKKTKFVTKSMLCVPLIVKDECVGAIQVINKKSDSGQFDKIDVDMLENLANSGAIAIKNARLYENEQRIKELNTLLHISKELTATLDLDRVLLSVVNLGSQAIDYKRAVLALFDKDDQIYLVAESDKAQVEVSTEENTYLKKIMQSVISSGNSLYITHHRKKVLQKGVPDIANEYMDKYDLQSLYVIILSDSEGNLGLLSMEGIFPTMIPPQSKNVIDMLVNQASIAIRNARLYQNIASGGIAERFKSGVKITGKTWRRLAMVAVLLVIAGVAIVSLPLPANVLSDVEIIPDHKSQVTAVSSGIIEKVLFKEGDFVKKGQILVELDTALLDLEKIKLENDIQIIQSNRRLLESEGQPTEIRLKTLELLQARNRLEGVMQKLEFARIRAHRSGIILTTKPEELVNKQINQGEVITEIAAENLRRGKLLILEKDILKVKSGDTVSLALQALPGVVVEGSISAVSHLKTEDEDGNRHYEGYLESEQLNQLEEVKFGMTGKAKIYIGLKTLYELYFRSPLLYLYMKAKLAMTAEAS